MSKRILQLSIAGAVALALGHWIAQESGAGIHAQELPQKSGHGIQPVKLEYKSGNGEFWLTPLSPNVSFLIIGPYRGLDKKPASTSKSVKVKLTAKDGPASFKGSVSEYRIFELTEWRCGPNDDLCGPCSLYQGDCPEPPGPVLNEQLLGHERAIVLSAQ